MVYLSTFGFHNKLVVQIYVLVPWIRKGFVLVRVYEHNQQFPGFEYDSSAAGPGLSLSILTPQT